MKLHLPILQQSWYYVATKAGVCCNIQFSLSTMYATCHMPSTCPVQCRVPRATLYVVRHASAELHRPIDTAHSERILPLALTAQFNSAVSSPSEQTLPFGTFPHCRRALEPATNPTTVSKRQCRSGVAHRECLQGAAVGRAHGGWAQWLGEPTQSRQLSKSSSS
jgi:hypothetical protein